MPFGYLYSDTLDIIPRQPRKHIPIGNNPGEVYPSDVKPSIDSSSSSSDEEESDMNQAEGDDGAHDPQSRDEGRSVADGTMSRMHSKSQEQQTMQQMLR